MYSSHFLQWLRKANLVSLVDELAKSNKINLSQLPDENERVMRQLQDKHMKDLIRKTKVFQSEIFSNLHWKKLHSLMANWSIEKNAIRNIVRFLTHKIPVNPEPCCKCSETTSKEHLVGCKKSVWTSLVNQFMKIKSLRKYLATLVETCADWLQLPSYIINFACEIKK